MCKNQVCHLPLSLLKILKMKFRQQLNESVNYSYILRKYKMRNKEEVFFPYNFFLNQKWNCHLCIISILLPDFVSDVLVSVNGCVFLSFLKQPDDYELFSEKLKLAMKKYTVRLHQVHQRVKVFSLLQGFLFRMQDLRLSQGYSNKKCIFKLSFKINGTTRCRKPN